MPRCIHSDSCRNYDGSQIEFRVNMCGEYEEPDYDYTPNCDSFPKNGVIAENKYQPILIRLRAIMLE